MIWKTRTLSNISPLSSTEVCTKVDRISPVVNMELRLEQIIKNQDHLIILACMSLFLAYSKMSLSMWWMCVENLVRDSKRFVETHW